MKEERNVPLSQSTTLRLGGNAARFVYAESEAEVAAVVREADARGEAVLMLGGGSNLVVGDGGFDGVVVKCAFDAIRICNYVARHERARGAAPSTPGDASNVRVSVDAGVGWEALVERAVAEGWSGVEALSGIPGSVGATPMQNVGAYGQEVSDTIASVRAFDRRENEFVEFAAQTCGFSYRSSRFKGDDRFVITAVEFVFAVDRLGAAVRYGELSRALGIAEGERAPAMKIREAVIALRRGKGMVLDPADSESVSAGSFFTNPIVDAALIPRIAEAAGAMPPTFPAGPGGAADAAGVATAGIATAGTAAAGSVKVAAAWLIERAGFEKGQPLGPVGLSKKHALALVHRGGGRTADLLDVARSIRDGVHAKFGVTLAVEPVLVGCKL